MGLRLLEGLEEREVDRVGIAGVRISVVSSALRAAMAAGDFHFPFCRTRLRFFCFTVLDLGKLSLSGVSSVFLVKF